MDMFVPVIHSKCFSKPVGKAGKVANGFLHHCRKYVFVSVNVSKEK